MRIKIILTRGEAITVTEEQAAAILASAEPLVALKGPDGKWSGDVVHRSHIVQMVRDYEAEKQDRLKNPRLAGPPEERFTGDISKFRPRWMKSPDINS